MIRVPISRVRAGLSVWAGGVARGGETVMLTVRGRDLAALVPVSMVRMAREVGRILPDVSEAATGLSEPAAGACALSDRGQGGS